MNRRALAAALVAGITLIAIAAWLRPALPVDDASWTNRYDHIFKKHAKRQFSVLFDWRWFKAQAIVESTLTRDARSKKGALGIMQILPSTFGEIFRAQPLLPGITEPRWNIAAGIAFDRYLYERWHRRVPTGERLTFTWGSYNAGYRNIANARASAAKAGLDNGRWRDVSRHAPRQTKSYVRKIRRLMEAPG